MNYGTNQCDRAVVVKTEKRTLSTKKRKLFVIPFFSSSD